MKEKVSILLVDDRPENLTTLEAVLSSPDYELVKAASGQEALKLLLTRDFAVVLLDVQMPEMDGFETAMLIRGRKRSRQTPIIFITAISTEERFVHKGYEAGAVDYLFKPFDPAVLRSKVSVFAELHRKTILIKQQAELVRERHIVQLEIESLRRYQNLADAIPHIVWKTQPNGFVDYANRVWLDYSGLTREQTAGMGWLACFNAEDAQALQKTWARSAALRSGFELEARIQRASDGADRWHLVRVVPELDLSGQVTAWLCTATEVHDRKAAQEALERAKDIAEAANEAKSRFLANVSHEIRTPLGAILGFAELLNEPGMAKQGRVDCAETIRRNGQQLLRIVDEILDLSKIEAGRMRIESIAFDPQALVEETRATLSIQARKKNLALEISWQTPAPPAVVSDPTRLRQILTNVIGNSLKFTERGGVDVRISASDEGGVAPGRRARLRFTVSDTGCGLGPEEKRRLFQPFGQADTTITRKFGGTGLGLTLSRQLARSLDGDLTLVESVPGVGSTFVIEIGVGISQEAPARPPSPPPAREENAPIGKPSLEGMRILLAEDGPDNQLLVTHILNANGATVEVVEDGEAAVRRALGSDFDLVLMDIQMPLMNGYEATRKLREARYPKPVIAFTAYAMQDERDRCLGAGCNDYITKPIDHASLLKTIARVAGPRLAGLPVARAPQPSPAEGAGKAP